MHLKMELRYGRTCALAAPFAVRQRRVAPTALGLLACEPTAARRATLHRASGADFAQNKGQYGPWYESALSESEIYKFQILKAEAAMALL
jgi:hypothetical protein